ncbi:TPM domain-containing protein [Pedobacter sp. PAMC26386]|nr:TPM domain-containing protein [Pedobacter sp. PAMC26386]
MLFLLVLGMEISFAQHYYTVHQIPDPKIIGTGYISNPDMVLSSNTADSLGHTISMLENKTKVEIAVVVVRNFEENEDIFNFALKLFNKWGVGKAQANNGLMLFIAADRKQYRFVTGYGLEGLLPDAALKRIGDHYLLPAFKKEDYGTGTTEALITIAEYLGQPANKKELDQLLGKKGMTAYPWFVTIIPFLVILLLFVLVLGDLKKMTPFISQEKAKEIIGYDKVNGIGCAGLLFSIFILIITLGFEPVISWFKHLDTFDIAITLYVVFSFFLLFRYFNALSAIRKANVDDLNFVTTVKTLNSRARWYLIASPLILLGLITESIRNKRSAGRFKAVLDSQNREMSRIDRNENKSGTPYLDPGQLAEEKFEVNTYDIWVSQDLKEQKIVSYEGNQFKSFEVCPQCNFRTFKYHKVIPVIKPTYSKEGEGKEARTCGNCGFEELIKMIVLPKISLTGNDSGSSGSGGSGDSSSSSSSSSWGGGSSGGGGAGGSW